MKKCPHLQKWTVSSCRANKKPYVPSIYELEEYCNDEGHERCPLYKELTHSGAAALSGQGVRGDWGLSGQHNGISYGSGIFCSADKGESFNQ